MVFCFARGPRASHLPLHSPLSPPPPQAIKKSKKLAKRKTLKFAVDCSQPVDDGIMDAASFVSRERGAPGLDGWG